MSEPVLLCDDPCPRVRRVTLNRPAKRNALDNELRADLFSALREADADREVSVVVIRGAGSCFSAGYDLGTSLDPVERHSATTDGWWARHVVAGWFELWDMATPIIAQVHGWCLAGGSELATACDLVYVADDAQIGYPPVRSISAPDMAWQPWMLGMRRGMEALLTGDSISGAEAATLGFATRSFPPDELESSVLAVAARIAKVPFDLLSLNKRVCHRAMEAKGIRTGIRATSELNALGLHQRSSQKYLAEMKDSSVREGLTARDAAFGDYRETPKGETSQSVSGGDSAVSSGTAPDAA
jgi:enoyl-CoA hydratase